MELVILWPDTHIPYHDVRKVNIMLDIMRDVKPDHLCFLGDLDDMAAPSRFAEGTPDEWKDRVEITTASKTRQFLADIRDMLPDTEMVYLEGNHELRLTDYVSKNAPALDGYVTLPKILDLDNLGIDFHRYEHPPVKLYNEFYGHHGSYTSKHPGDGAKKELLHYGVSGFSGHTHSVGFYHSTQLDGRVLRWYECGHLSDTKQMHYNQHFNWQHGFGYLWLDAGKTYPFLAEFEGNTVVFDGVKYPKRG